MDNQPLPPPLTEANDHVSGRLGKSIFVIGAVAGIIGTVLGIYSTIKSSELGRDVSGLIGRAYSADERTTLVEQKVQNLLSFDRPAWTYQVSNNNINQRFDLIPNPEGGPYYLLNYGTIDFSDAILKSDNSVKTGRDWSFTAPEPGVYLVAPSVAFGSEEPGLAPRVGFYALLMTQPSQPPEKYRSLGSIFHAVAPGWSPTLSGNQVLFLLKGQSFSLKAVLRMEGPGSMPVRAGSVVSIVLLSRCQQPAECRTN